MHEDVLILGSGYIGKELYQQISSSQGSTASLLNRTTGGYRKSYDMFLEEIKIRIEKFKPRTLINCVGVFDSSDVFDDESLKFDKIFVANTKFAWDVSRIFCRNTERASTWRNIVNIGSESAHIPHTDSALYCASKAALKMLTKNMARDLRDEKICAFQIDPGVVRESPMSKDVLSKGKTEVSSIEVERLCEFIICILSFSPYVNGNCYKIGNIIR